MYVALSRCTSFNGLVLKSQIPRNRISTNNKVIEFAKTETPSTLIVQELNSGKADYFYRRIREEIKQFNFNEAYYNFIKAIKFRNDIETETFKKYFFTTANKFSSYKSKFEFLNSDYQDTKLLIEKINTKLLNSQNENTMFRNKIEEQNRGLKVLLDKTQEYETIIENESIKKNIIITEIEKLKIENNKYNIQILSFKSEIENLENKKNELKRIKESKVLEINHLNKENTKLENKISNKESEIIELKTIQNILEDSNRKYIIEIERQKNIKWYQKLIGKT